MPMVLAVALSFFFNHDHIYCCLSLPLRFVAATLSLNSSCNSSSVDGVPSEYQLFRSNVVSTNRSGFGYSTVQLAALLQQLYMKCVIKLL